MFGKPPLAVLFPWLALALTLLSTAFSRGRFLRRHDDYKSVLLYFASFFVLLFVFPVLLILLFSDRPAEFLKLVGLTPGHFGRGLLLTAAALPLAFLSARIGSADPKMRAFYPFAKSACAGRGRFALYESAYLVLYYLPWEFAYRGLLFFPILAATDLPTALAIQAALSTLYHLGHPETEIFAALGAGFAFGLVAYWTQSVFYSTLIHAFVGLSTDLLICRRARRDSGR